MSLAGIKDYVNALFLFSSPKDRNPSNANQNNFMQTLT